MILTNALLLCVSVLGLAIPLGAVLVLRALSLALDNINREGGYSGG